MENTLFPKDNLVVNKFVHGLNLPTSVNDIPIIRSFFEKEVGRTENLDTKDPLDSFKEIEREEILVFKSIEDRKKNLVKRVIGLPGDTISIKNTSVFINGISLSEKENYKFNYLVNDKILKFSNKEKLEYLSDSSITVKRKIYDPKNGSNSIFPFEKLDEWSQDNFGPLWIPKKGNSIILTENNYFFYKEIISKFENTKIKLVKGQKKMYTFKLNYYFFLGDNRHSSIDSRYFGIIPETLIQGKVVFLF